MSIRGYYKNSLIFPALYSGVTGLVMEVPYEPGAGALDFLYTIKRHDTTKGADQVVPGRHHPPGPGTVEPVRLFLNGLF